MGRKSVSMLNLHMFIIVEHSDCYVVRFSHTVK